VKSKISNCRMSESKLERVVFDRTQFSDNEWNFDCIEGAIFNQVQFRTPERLLSAIKKSRRRKWKQPPLFKSVVGLTKDDKSLLKKKGAIVKEGEEESAIVSS